MNLQQVNDVRILLLQPANEFVLSNQQLLQNNQLLSIDVVGDDNCFFRAVSVNIVHHGQDHSAIRQSVAVHMEQLSRATFVSLNAESLLQRAAEVRKCSIWASEDIILATANYLKQDIHVITASKTTAPLVCSLSIPSNKDLFL